MTSAHILVLKNRANVLFMLNNAGSHSLHGMELVSGIQNWTNCLLKARPAGRARGLNQGQMHLSNISSYSYFLVELVLCCSVFRSIFCLVSSLNVSPLPELFGKPWLVAVAHMNAN